MKWPDPAQGPARLVNRILADQDWARAKLQAMAGRAFTLAVGPLASTLSIAADGTLAAASTGTAADLTLSISPLALPAFLADPARWNEFVRETGDAELGGVLKELARTLPWFVEAAFARALGPIAGQRVADTGRRLLAFPEYAAQRWSDSVGSYARDEAGLLARGADARRLRDEIDEVARRVDALAQRVEALDPRVAPIR